MTTLFERNEDRVTGLLKYTRLEENVSLILASFDFSGQKTLLSCLYDFLKQEKLEGDNQYYCNGCESKQDATRCVRLSQLPPVRFLNFYSKFIKYCSISTFCFRCWTFNSIDLYLTCKRVEKRNSILLFTFPKCWKWRNFCVNQGNLF